MSRIARAKIGAPEMAAISEAAEEAGVLQRKLMREADMQLLAKFKADANLNLNEVDRGPFREATAPVIDAWRKKSKVGPYVTRLVDAARS